MSRYLTDLAAACRKSGLPIQEVPGWRTRGRGPMHGPHGVMWHHTATPDAARGDYPSLHVITRGRPDLSPPLANLGLARSGTVLVIAAGKAHHAGRPDNRARYPWAVGNSDIIGIEIESAGHGHYTDAQWAAAPRLRDALSEHYKLKPDRHIAHREWAPSRKIDPRGLDIRALHSEDPMSTPDAMAMLRDIASRLVVIERNLGYTHDYAKMARVSTRDLPEQLKNLRNRIDTLAARLDALEATELKGTTDG